MSGYLDEYLLAVKAEIIRLTDEVEKSKTEIAYLRVRYPNDHRFINEKECWLMHKRHSLMTRTMQLCLGPAHPQFTILYIWKTQDGLYDHDLRCGDCRHG
jgi:hypothetical protein